MNRYFIGLLALFLSVPPALAQQDDDDASTPGPKRCPETQASTVFVPDKSGSRQKGSAKRLSETHRTAQDQGWDFSDLEIYIEDGDLQGFFVTYVRPHPCNDRS
jgi:hypothetical protein